MPLWILWSSVLLAPALCVHGIERAYWTLTGRPERFLPLSQTLMLRAVLVSLPFLVLAMVATHARKAATPAWTAALLSPPWIGYAMRRVIKGAQATG